MTGEAYRAGWSGAVLLCCVAVVIMPAVARGGDPNVYKDDHFELNVAGRLQPRFEYDKVQTKSGALDTQNQFFLRRTRMQLNGKVFGCFFKLHWKIDNVNQIGKTATPQAEDAYAECPLVGDLLGVRFGLYDMPFSRDLLVSDEKQLAVDRGQVSDLPSSFGLADNTFGLSVYGRAFDHLEYRASLVDNRNVANEDQDIPTVAGRIDYNVFGSKGLDPWSASWNDDAHWGDEKYLSVGIDGVYGVGTARPGSTTAAAVPRGFGFDAMTDLPLGPGRVFVSGELNRIYSGPKAKGQKVITVWMLQGGYLIKDHVEPFIRVDQSHTQTGGKVTELAEPEAGVDVFLLQHTLQLQFDVMKRFPETGAAIDRVRLQAQVYW